MQEVQFQPTLPARGATSVPRTVFRTVAFQPTLPARGATFEAHDAAREADISTHAPRTGSDKKKGFKRCRLDISTHAPRTGSDTAHTTSISGLNDFNPRSPHGERPNFHQENLDWVLFQPTLPARGATG